MNNVITPMDQMMVDYFQAVEDYQLYEDNPDNPVNVLKKQLLKCRTDMVQMYLKMRREVTLPREMVLTSNRITELKNDIAREPDNENLIERTNKRIAELRKFMMDATDELKALMLLTVGHRASVSSLEAALDVYADTMSVSDSDSD